MRQVHAGKPLFELRAGFNCNRVLNGRCLIAVTGGEVAGNFYNIIAGGNGIVYQDWEELFWKKGTECIELIKAFDTGAAPGCPKIEDDEFAFLLLQTYLLMRPVNDIGKFKRRHGIANGDGFGLCSQKDGANDCQAKNELLHFCSLAPSNSPKGGERAPKGVYDF